MIDNSKGHRGFLKEIWLKQIIIIFIMTLLLLLAVKFFSPVVGAAMTAPYWIIGVVMGSAFIVSTLIFWHFYKKAKKIGVS